MPKLKDVLKKKSDAVLKLIEERTENGVSVINNGSRAIGTPFTVTEALSPHPPIEAGGKEWLGWNCSEKNSRGDARVLTPNGLGQFASYPAVKWVGDISDAFTPEGDTYEEQIASMEKWLSENDGKVKVVAKCEHPRFEKQFIYAYGVNE